MYKKVPKVNSLLYIDGVLGITSMVRGGKVCEICITHYASGDKRKGGNLTTLQEACMSLVCNCIGRKDGLTVTIKKVRILKV